MNQKQLEERGFEQVSVAELFELTPEEQQLVELKLILGTAVKRIRQEVNITQDSLARRLGSSQSRVSKIEAGDPDVSLDLQCRAFFVGLGASLEDLANIIIENENSRISSVGTMSWNDRD